ncbi:MAG: hypothetical protein JSV42_06095 [Chloroflexota bacterium]|nr:MAG: hypothetical protein JSV42_06095 [Chloroflexota bacterium]
MDSFDYSDDALQPATNSAAVVWNILTAIVLLMTFCVCVIVAWFMINPQNSMNPFPPPTLPVEAKPPTPTPTPRSVLPPTWTPAPAEIATATSQATITALPTDTQPPVAPTEDFLTQTPGDILASETPPGAAETPTPNVDMPFVLHPGDPVAINNIWHPELACNWMGVGGQAFDLTGAPIDQGLLVQLGGILDGEPVDNLGMIGMVSINGPGWYEFELADTPVESTQTLWIQLVDQAMLPLSDKVYFDTYADCDKNLILINFNQVR